MLISRKPFTQEDIRRARAALAAGSLQEIYIPGDEVTNAFGRLLTTSDPEEFYRNYRYDVSPVDDDRPFFFYTVQPRDLLNFIRNPTDSADYKINRAVPLLFGLMGVSIIATIVILVLPPSGSGCEAAARGGRAANASLLPLHRSRIHTGAGCLDSEIRHAAGPPHLCADCNHFLDACF